MAEKFDAQVIAAKLMGSVQDLMEKTCKSKLSEKPVMETKEIIEYGSRMRVLGLSKFDGPCYVAAVNLYLNQKKSEDKDACGVIVSYWEQETAEGFVRALQKGLDLEDPDVILDSCGEFCNSIAGQFKNELAAFGYPELNLSTIIKARNEIDEGVDFPFSEGEYCELSFKVKNKKVVVVSLVMAPPA
ncbi:MAG: chemotaxis protein CheX [Candidatus Omnitrophica bacterium]|nr:chemotaxis protein CheX [Candidatus Omnitrophota bacterium]